MWPFRGTATGIQDRSPQTTSVGHLGHGGVDRRHLAPGDDHRCGRVLPAEAPVGALDEMLARLLLERLARRREDASRPRAARRSPRPRSRTRRPRGVRSARSPATAGVELHRGVEQHGAHDAVGVTGRHLGDELAAEAVPDPRRLGDPEGVRRLDEVGDVLLDAPRRLPARAAMAAVVDADRRGTSGGAPRQAGETAGRGRRRRAGRRRAAPPDPPIP